MVLKKCCPGDERASGAGDEEGEEEEVEFDSDMDLSDDDDDNCYGLVEWEDKFKNYYFRNHHSDVSKYYRGAIVKYGIFNNFSGVTSNASENLNRTIKVVVVEPEGQRTLFGCSTSIHMWQNRLLIDVKRAIEGRGGEFRVKKKFVSAAKRAKEIEIIDLDDKFVEHEEDEPAATAFKDDVNLSAKERIAREYHRLRLVHPMHRANGDPTGAYEVLTHFHKSCFVIRLILSCS